LTVMYCETNSDLRPIGLELGWPGSGATGARL
jgi:hypothetical protein